jgi:hypothetical protein
MSYRCDNSKEVQMNMTMKSKTTAACAMIAALGMAVPVAAQTQAGSAAASSGKGPSTNTGVVNAERADSQSMTRLSEAAQRLRETIQALANAPAGPQRNAAIATARQALLDTQQAMIDLPPDLRTANVQLNDAEYAKAMDKLKEAAQRLRDSTHAMATQPAGERRNAAIGQVNKALLEVNQAMVQLPWEPGGPSTARTGSTSGSGASGTTASGSPTSAFDNMDRNRDGVISRSEFSQHTQR